MLVIVLALLLQVVTSVRISDEEQIHDLLYTYAHAVDSKDWELYRSCFSETAEIDYTPVLFIAISTVGLYILFYC